MELTYFLLLCLQSFICVIYSFFAYQNPIFLLLLVLMHLYRNQIFLINSVFIERRLRVILTLTSLITTNLAILKLLKLSSGNLIASTTTISNLAPLSGNTVSIFFILILIHLFNFLFYFILFYYLFILFIYLF